MTFPENKPSRVFTKATIAYAMKENERILVVFESKVYDVTKFAKYHPGGQLALKHMAGKDSTEAIYAFHGKAVVEEKLPRYYVGEFLDAPKLGSDFDDVLAERIPLDEPPMIVSSVRPLDITKDYCDLIYRFRDLGFFKPSFVFYAWRFVLFASVLTTSIGILRADPSNVLNVVTSAFMLAFVWHGLSFSAHDAGHHSVTTERKYDTYIGIFIANFIGGLSIGWWKFNHNIHHIVTNDPEHDPDIQHMPVFAISSKFFSGLYSSFHKRVMEFDVFSQNLIRIQHLSFLPIMSFGRFNLYAQSLLYLFRTDPEDAPKHRWLELSGICFFWFWYGYCLVYLTIPSLFLRLLFVWISHAATMILHLQITLSHFAMSVDSADDESFAVKALRTTMNVDCPTWFDWFHGGLQFQIEHHLFPRIPRVHFRAVQPYVKEFCEKHGLVYNSYGFIEGNVKVLETLKVVAQQIGLLISSASGPRFKST